MPQSLLTAWLSKPATDAKAAIRDEHAGEPVTKEILPSDLPTPPSSSPEKGAGDNVNAASRKPEQQSSHPPWGSSRPFLSPHVHLCPCTKADIPAFKRLNNLLLPIPYPDSFYRETIEDQEKNHLTLLAYWHDDPSTIGTEKGTFVGAVRGKLLTSPPAPTLAADVNGSGIKQGPMLYLVTLSLLSPYRGHGIASHMLSILTKRAVETHGITSVGAHVWEANTEGLEWYRKRGFKEVKREEGYYKRLKPATAIVMQRQVSVLDFANG
ncbi:hypothetical protein B0A50_04354 [Salinomyces thailandicus]|uniref:N-acetyltransferase domain-containing protein n=1 Tax=Salinomyces thailandicus TaxID=706561 RepID=A0A4U0TYR4_9PEZI|nr:hypothetical protein B0A50_04354 [Salinomyces thailandica]